MKKLSVIISLVLTLMLCATAFAATVQMQSSIDVNDLQDCTIPVSFNVNDITDADIPVTVYEHVIYDLVDVNQMQVGDTIDTSWGEIEVQSIETNDLGEIEINGGMYVDGGVTLYADEETNGFMERDFEYAAVAECGAASVAFADQVTVNCYKIAEDLGIAGEGYDTVTVAPADVKAEIAKIAEKLGDDFDCYQTTARIEGGKLVEITIDFMP